MPTDDSVDIEFIIQLYRTVWQPNTAKDLENKGTPVSQE